MRKYSCRSPIRANALAVNTMYGSWVRPKIAGIESSANSTSVVPIASITTSIGVMTRLPFCRIHSLVPW